MASRPAPSPPLRSSPPPPSLTSVDPAAVGNSEPRASEMEISQILDEASTIWDWGNLLDFTVDDQLISSWDSDQQPVAHFGSEIGTEQIEQLSGEAESGGSDRVRKRDPRMICSNFLAGRIPCACPELDAKMREEEEEEAGIQKRARMTTIGIIQCQVPGCEADISELKGYHRRHRVCLRCANAPTVVLDGQTKRYCQQCGKFHLLPDFDEGKRSCRRKLERHNRRRRRKAIDVRGALEKEPQTELQAEVVPHDDEAGKDSLCLSNQIESEALLDKENAHVSTICSAPSSQNVQNGSVLSFVASNETQSNIGKDNTRYAISSSFCDDKSAYSSMCPTGRISFKLYDWNPAEFPRRLRHQIFQWLASMPVELEGYIRPGCIILTVFISMPRFMWRKLSEDATSYVRDIVSAPESMLSGRGTLLVYLNNMIFQVSKDGKSMSKVNMEVRAPRLHYVYPTCFEAGKPMEFVACGSNIFQTKFRFLISFAGKYIPYDYCHTILHGRNEACHDVAEDTAHDCDHQIYKIYIPHTDPKLFGPAFIEVENEFGLSNFISILFGDRETCSEMQIVQQRFDTSCPKSSRIIDAFSNSCEDFVSSQTSISDLLLDIAWFLKEPKLEDFEDLVTSTQIQRFNCLLNFLIHNEFTTILKKVLQSLKIVMDKAELPKSVTKTADADMRLFWKLTEKAREIVHQKCQLDGGLAIENSAPSGDRSSQSYNQNHMLCVVPYTYQGNETSEEKKLEAVVSSTSDEGCEAYPLINREVVMNVNARPHLMNRRPQKSCVRILSNTKMCSRPLVLTVAIAALCLATCTVLFHPEKVGEFAVNIRRCLFGNS